MSNSNPFRSNPAAYPPQGSGIATTLLSHPPSRLSPPPGVDLSDILGPPVGTSTSSSGAGPSKPNSNGNYNSTSSMNNHANTVPQTQPGPQAGNNAESKKKKDDKEGYTPKRGYRACVHCRLRKARCDLGDVNAPSEPPCSRCRREQRDCVFLPTKRRRKASTAEPSQREESLDAVQVEVYPAHASSSGGSAPPQPQQSANQSTMAREPPAAEWNLSFSQLAHPPGSMKEEGGSHFAQPSNWPDNHPQPGYDDGRRRGSLVNHTGSVLHTQNNTTHSMTSALQTTPQSTYPMDTTTPGSLGDSSTASTSALSPGHRAKKRRTEPEGTRKIVNASLSNEMDALEILANAATDGEGDIEGGNNKVKSANGGDTKRVSWDVGEEDTPPVKELRDFHLIKNGVLDERGLQELVNLFFQHLHPALPIFQTARLPRTREQLRDLAHSDPFLLTCIIAVASRHPSDNRYKDVHDRTWAILRETMADYSFAGLPSSVGFVEGVLLLAEHLPREKATPPRDYSIGMLAGPGTEAAGAHGTDNRRSWALIGLAIRAAYLLGLDQIALEIDEAQRTPDVERARRLAFWSRGPSLCFVGYSHISQTGEAAARINFPLQLSPGADTDETLHDDSASLMQSLVELTQIMTNAHDILYPSKSRTAVLVRQGEYFLFLDHFRRALDSYRTIWKPKKWSNLTLQELSWMTYHFVRLYVSSFGYSAHVKRSQWRAEEEASAGRDGSRQSVQLFPRGSATSPDALYIYESIGAANEIMHISLRLAQMGSIRYLPSRYLINISYAAVFALKSSYSGAVVGKDMLRIRELVDHVCAALVLACPDKDHPAVRYGQMLRMLSKKLEQLSDASAVPSRFPSPEPTSDTAPPPNFEPTPMPWTLPTDTSDLPSFHFPAFPDMTFPLSGMGGTSTASGTASANGIPTSAGSNGQSGLLGLGGGSGGQEHNPHLGLGAIAGESRSQQDGLFDFDGNFDFDLKGFWDDFTLGEGSGFPFR
ncbi:hypothetical protein CI109_104179 [Kwoniella shandongensis]|uniref:Uncharacterized protein n=1 Tax=Kwoniella shandongensis TaxID=1734106 RepID=A0A5M6C213_9TREE|nr:uncharacterized protein CI109_002909 [Kwoniella shandongensis]KAA5528751.1 hypothetical protein CI109_002909 [Kwoniella shandongensis]